MNMKSIILLLDIRLIDLSFSDLVPFVACAAMAAGDAFATKGHVSKLQSSTQLHEPSLKPKPPGAKKEELHTETKLKAGLLHGRKLEENLGSLLVVSDNGCAFHVEVHSVQKQERI